MKNIVLTRVDDRLLHGQVVISWVPYLHVEEIVVVDDDYAEDEFLRDILKEAAPEYVALKVATLSEAARYLKSEDDGHRTLVLSRRVSPVYSLCCLGVNIGVLNIGSVVMGALRSRHSGCVGLCDHDIKLLSEMEAKGVDVELRMRPTDKPVKLCSIESDYAEEIV